MILDKLMEKKDLLAYIGFRIKQLNQKDIIEYPESEREFQKQRLLGRIKELEHLKNIIKSGDIKKESIKTANSVKPLQ